MPRFRILRKDLPFVLTAVATLALGIGASTAIFSIFNGLFLESLPYPEASRLVHLNSSVPSRNLPTIPTAYIDYREWQKSQAFSQLAGFHSDGSYLTGFGQAVRVNVTNVTSSLAPVLGIRPVLGRSFLPEEDSDGSAWSYPSGHRVALLSYGLWKRYFQGSTTVLGKTVTLDNLPFTIVGVLPRAAVYPADSDVWVPIGFDSGHVGYFHDVVGRLNPGFTATQAGADLVRIHAALALGNPRYRSIVPVVGPLRDFYLSEYKPVTRILLAAVGFVLLIASLDVSGLMLARGAARTQEFAIRAALGASRAALVRQLLAEALLLAGAGAVAGALLGWAAVRAILSLLPHVLPSWVDFGVDLRFLAFTLAVTGGVALLASAVPALELPRIAESLAAASARASASAASRRSLSLLVVAEIAAAIVVLCAGSLVLKAFQRVMRVDEGFQPENVLTFSVDPPLGVNDPSNGRRRVAYAQDLLERLRSAPGIEAAGMTDALPLGATRALVSVTFPFQPEGAPPPDASQPQAMVTGTKVTPGYFRAMRIPLRQGRDFDSHDTWQADAAMVNESLALRYWPRQSAVGKRFRSGTRWFTIVGVVADTRDDGPEQPVRPRAFWPYPDVVSYLNIVVRGRMGTAALVQTAREAARQADPNVTIFDVETMRQLLNRTLWTRRAYSWLFAAFAIIALLMAVTGIYGVISYSVTRRTREIGIRMALGADRRGVVAQILRAGLMLAAAGAAIGLPAAWFATGLISSLLAGVSTHDPEAYAAVVVILAAAALAATFIPARRAAAVDPLKALRFD